jgi:uncharacterized protein with LGFP repeats
VQQVEQLGPNDQSRHLFSDVLGSHGDIGKHGAIGKHERERRLELHADQRCQRPPYTVEGPILAKYNALDDKARKDLGAPTGNEQKNPDGVYQQFDGGVIVYKTQAYVVWGKIRDKWNQLGGSQGQLGYPTSDEVDTPDGLKKSTFEHGTITWKPGDAEATVTNG